MSGSFAGNPCILAPAPAGSITASACSMTYTPSAPGSQTISATYAPADSVHAASSCSGAGCATLAVTSPSVFLPQPTLTPTATPTPSTTVSPTPTPTATPGCATVTYVAGYNLAGGPTGTVLTGAAGSLFTFQASDSAYESFPASTALSGGIGVWAFFFTPTTVTLPCVTAQTLHITLPTNHFIMVGNPDDVAVTLSGADVVDTFNPATNAYTTATGTVTLQPGQGAWVFSRAGGTLTLTPTGP